MRIWATCWLSGVRTLKARATPQRFLARIQHGLTMALDADRAYTHRLTKTPDHPTWRTFGSALTPTSWGVRDYLGDRLLPSHDWKRWGREERHAVRWPAEVGISSTVGLLSWHLWERACRSHADALNSLCQPTHNTRSASGGQSVAKWTWTNIRQPLFKIQAERKPERSE
jgi:hypothetical protein